MYDCSKPHRNELTNICNDRKVYKCKCGKQIDKKYTTCFTCLQKDKPNKCLVCGKMIGENFKYCFEHNPKQK